MKGLQPFGILTPKREHNLVFNHYVTIYRSEYSITYQEEKPALYRSSLCFHASLTKQGSHRAFCHLII